MASSIEAITPFVHWASTEADIPVQVVGGVASAALAHPSTVIDMQAQQIVAADDFELSTIRPNGTIRDFDVLVLSSDDSDISAVEDAVDATVGDSLEQSVFGLKTEADLLRQTSRPFGFAALKTVVSDRYVLETGMVKSLMPFSLPIDSASLETWQLTSKGVSIPVPHPAMQLINYMNRSISGVRPKDKDKLTHMADEMFARHPDLKEWAVDGPGASQLELGLLIRALTPDNNHPDVFGTGVQVLSTEDLLDHEAFMMPTLDERQRRKIIAVAAFKAKSLSRFESNPMIVALWQKYAERHMSNIVKNT